MITVVLTDDSTCIYGHAGYAPRGADIVCARVSAVIQTAIYGLIAIAAKHGDFVKVNDQRREHAPWHGTPEQEAILVSEALAALIDSVNLGLQAITETYGPNRRLAEETTAG